MTIQVFIKAQPDGLSGGFWVFKVRYFKEHGNTQDDILNTNSGFVQHTSLYQLYLKATLEAMLYINTLTEDSKPDTQEITIHMPCKECIQWLQENERKMLTPKDRAKTKRGYKQFVTAIITIIEINQWKIKYELSEEI